MQVNISIPREIAAVIAPLLDRGQLKAEGTVTGYNNTYVIPISVEFFAAKDVAQSLMEQLSLRLDLRGQPVLPPSRPVPQRPKQPQYTRAPIVAAPPPPTYDAIVQKSIAFDARAIKDSPEQYGLSIQDLEALPMAIQPEQVKTKMLSYQLQGLAWLLQMEHPQLPQGNQVKQFWTKKNGNWFNTATNLYPMRLEYQANLVPSKQNQNWQGEAS